MKPEDNKPTILTLFGATGDLSAKQILPSLYKLFKSNHLPDMFHVFGFSHREYDTNDFRQHVKDALGRFGDLGDKKDAEEFLENVSFVQGDFTVKDDY